jgi:hypothetical protein
MRREDPLAEQRLDAVVETTEAVCTICLRASRMPIRRPPWVKPAGLMPYQA